LIRRLTEFLSSISNPQFPKRNVINGHKAQFDSVEYIQFSYMTSKDIKDIHLRNKPLLYLRKFEAHLIKSEHSYSFFNSTYVHYLFRAYFDNESYQTRILKFSNFVYFGVLVSWSLIINILDYWFNYISGYFIRDLSII